MRKKVITFVVLGLLALALTAPAFAGTGLSYAEDMDAQVWAQSSSNTAVIGDDTLTYYYHVLVYIE